jgi:hypothetical protein
MTPARVKLASIVMIAAQVASLCDGWTLATAHASPPRRGPAHGAAATPSALAIRTPDAELYAASFAALATRSVTSLFLADVAAHGFQVEAARPLAEWFAQPFRQPRSAPSTLDVTARVPQSVIALMTPIITPCGPVWVKADAIDAEIAAVDAEPTQSDPTPAPIPDNEPASEEDEPAPAPQSAGTVRKPALVAQPEAAGAVVLRRSRKSAWMWTGSAVLLGLFVAGFSHDLSNDPAPPPEPESLPDFPDAP